MNKVMDEIATPARALGGIKTDDSKLTALKGINGSSAIEVALKALREDHVVLVQNLSPADADQMMGAISDALDIRDQLEIQAGFASIQGHRENIGRYYMSVNKRDNYEFIPPHSEGTSSINMQLASFYCYENTTDGGESILFNVDGESDAWTKLREQTKKVELNGYKVTPADVAQARMMYQLDLENDLLEEEDQLLERLPSPTDGVLIHEVLTKARKTYSRILGRDTYAYWDSIASVDHDSAKEYFRYLKDSGLLHQPPTPKPVEQLDNVHERRVWRSGTTFSELFKSCLIRKLLPGEFILMNNLTWVHSANNWTPESGKRHLAAAFA